MDSFQGKTGKWAFLPAPSALIPGGIAVVSNGAPIKNCFFVYYSSVGLVNVIPVGFQSQLFLGPITQES